MQAEPIAPAAALSGLSASSFLQLIWLASPALPVGGFAYSEGLEAAIEFAGITGEEKVSDWLADQLHLTLARADLPVIAQAITSWRCADYAQIKTLNDWLLQTRETSEQRLQTEQMGRSLLDWLRNQNTTPAVKTDVCAQLPPTYPVTFALAASQTEADATTCLLAYAFGWAENMVQAALKSVPLGQSSGQRILARLTAEIPGAVARAMALGHDEWQAFSPMLAILSSQHETQYSRLFRS